MENTKHLSRALVAFHILLRLSALAALLGVAGWGVITFFKAAEVEERQRLATAVANGTKQLPEAFSSMEYTSPTVTTEVQPALRWQGKDSSMLHVDSGVRNSRAWGPEPYWTVLGRSAGGRYFSATFKLSGRDCLVDKCLRLADFRQLSLENAKYHVFHLKDAALFEKLFNEKMPPAEVPA